MDEARGRAVRLLEMADMAAHDAALYQFLIVEERKQPWEAKQFVLRLARWRGAKTNPPQQEPGKHPGIPGVMTIGGGA